MPSLLLRALCFYCHYVERCVDCDQLIVEKFIGP